MRIVWDEPKRLANLEKHGLDFAALTLEFFSRAAIVDGYGSRKIAVGMFGKPIVVVFSTLGSEAISIVSMRAASRRERRLVP